MLKELTKTDWLNILNLPESRIPAVLILRGTRNFRAKYRAMLPYFDNVLDLGPPNGIIEDVLIGDVRGQLVGFACVYGSSISCARSPTAPRSCWWPTRMGKSWAR